MVKRTGLILTLVLLTGLLRAQDLPASSAPVIVVGKMLDHRDSLKIRELFFEGIHEKILQDIPRAENSFRKVLEIDPQNDAAMYELAGLSIANKREADAELFIRQAVTVNPDNEWYWVFLADLYKRTNRINDLVPVMDELIMLSPDNPDYHYDKANALSILNRTELALTAYDDIEGLFGPSDELEAARQRILIRQGKPEQVEAELEKQIADKPGDIRTYMYLAEVHRKEKEFGKAVDVLEKAKIEQPENAIIRLLLADNYRSLNENEKAFTELKAAFEDPALSIDEKVRIVLSFFPEFEQLQAREKADELAEISVRVHPDEAKAHALYGDVLFQESKFRAARDSYARALELNDQIYQIWEQMLRIEVSLGDFKNVVANGEEALMLFPNQGAIYLYTGIGYAQTGNQEKAISLLKDAAELLSENLALQGESYAAMGDAYNALKNYSESAKAFDKSLELDPLNSYVLNNYAYYLSLRGVSLEKAEAMAVKANELEPNNASFQDTYAWILFKRKKYKEAQVWIRKAIGNNEGNPTLEEHYGDILYMLGDTPQAVSRWQKAKEIGGASERLERKINEKRYIE